MIKLNLICKIFFLSVGLSLSSIVQGQVNGDYRTKAAGNWNAAATWQVRSSGAWVNCTAGNYPGVAAGAGTVTLTNNVTFNVNPANAIGALVIGANLTPNNANRNLTVNGDVSISAGTLNLSASNGTVFTLTIGGNFSISGGTITESANANGSIVFNKSGTQTFTKTGGTISNNINFTINSGSNFDIGLSVLNGSTGTFTLSSGATFTTANIDGISSAGATGSIQSTGTRTFSTGANYIYDGTNAQVTGTGLPGTVNNLTINNTAGVTLSGSKTVSSTLTLTNGAFIIGANTLTLNGPTIAGTPPNLVINATGSLVFGGTSIGVLIPTSVTVLNGLSISNTNIVTLQSSLTVGGTFSPSGAGLSIGANTLTLNGQINCGTLSGGATSNIVIGGGGTANLPAVTVNDLTINRAVSICGDVTVGGILTLTSGTFSIGGNTLTLNGPTIAGTPSNLVTTTASGLIFGGTNSGVLIPSVANLNNLTINNPGGVTMTGDVTISNTLNMSQGNITTGAFTLAISNGVVTSLNHTSGTIIGKFRRTVNTTSVDYIFPVGTTINHRPAIMNFTSLSAGTNITSEFIATSPAGFVAYSDGGTNLDYTLTEGFWRLFTSGLPVANYTLKLAGSGFTSYPINEVTRITGRDNSNSTWRALGLHGSQSGYVVARNGITNLNTTSFDFALATGCTTVSGGYRYERNITINSTKVEGGSNLYNFPVLINLSGQTFLRTSPAGDVLSSNGYDIIFTDDNYNELDHQLEYYNGTNGDLIAWVRIPTLSSSSNTIIKILYGNSKIVSDLSVTTVWDSHFKGIWHLDNNNLNDFTSNNKPGTPYNAPTYPAGKINNSIGLNGTSQYVEVLNNPNINFAGNITVSAWVYMSTGGLDQKIASNQNNTSGGYKFGIYTNNKVEFEIRNSANTASLNRDEPGGTVLSTGQWYYLSGISSDVLDSIKTFVNGIPERPFKKIGTLGVASDNLIISKEPFSAEYYFSGRFDELRISDEIRSNGWLRTEYNNQSSPSTFYVVDAVAIASNKLSSASICDGPINLTFGYPSGGTYSGDPNIVGNVFNPSSPGIYSLVYTYDGGCGPASVTKSIEITGTPPPPAAPNKVYCTQQIAYLEATSGENIRWYSSGNLVSTANPYSTGQTVPGTYNYTVTQTINGCESAATPVTLTILTGLTINTQPQPSTICNGGNASFTVDVIGFNLTYQWQEGGVNISNGGIYSGATTATLILTNPGIAKSGKLFRCVVFSPCGTSPVNSNTALLTVTAPSVATFSYTGTPYCLNAANPSPTFSGGGIAGTFSSTTGLVFVSAATGEVNITASTPGSYTVTNTIPAIGSCGIVTATSPITIISDLTWTGTVSTDWNVPGNWSCNFIPGPTTNVQILNVVNKPVLNAGAIGTANNILIDNGSSLTVSNNSLQVAGTITNSGTFDATNGTIVLNGSTAQTIGSGILSSKKVKNLTISNSSGVTLLDTVKVTSVVLVSNGSLASNGYLVLLSTGSGTALIDGSGTGIVTGNVTMQRYLPTGFGYKYFSSPFQSATVNEFADDMNLASLFTSFYKYDENRNISGTPASGWTSYKIATNILNPLAGYSINFGSNPAAKTVDVTGIVNNGDISVTLYNHNQIYTKGFNLIGNPYPSPINWDAALGWTKNNIDNALYYFKASTTDQYGGVYSTYINGISSDGIANNIIPSMQGILVHVSDGGYPVTGTLAMNNNVRITDLTHTFASKKGSATVVSLLRLTARFSDDISSVDPMVIYFNEKGTVEFDSQIDALKLLNTDLKIPNLYTVSSDGSKISINALPPISGDLCKIPLGLKLNRAGTGNVVFKISEIEASLSSYRIYLTDNISGAEQDLLPDKEYIVSLAKGEYNNRFFLNILKTADTTKTINVITNNPDYSTNSNLFSIYCSHGILKSEINILPGEDGTLMICNLTGQILFIEKIHESGYHEFNPGIKEGIYIVSFFSATKRSSKKIFIQNR